MVNIIDQDTKERINLALTKTFSNKFNLISLDQIAGDLSPRRYYRINLESELYQESSLVAMVFDSVTPPEAESKILRTSDQSYVELTNYLYSKKISVPKLVNDCRDIGVILIEDLSDNLLINIFLKKNNIEIKKYLRNAVDTVIKMQNIKCDKSFFAFNRELDNQTFLRESKQFIDYILAENVNKKTKDEALSVVEKLCNEVNKYQKVFVHRDFHAWNLIVDHNENLRVIDFQDALLGPRCYDLVPLIHERDVDYILSESIISETEEYFFSHFNDTSVKTIEYPRVQLQRDLKVSGLFQRIVNERKLTRYGEWIPGTIKRIKKTLSILSDQDKDYKKLLEIINNELKFE